MELHRKVLGEILTRGSPLSSSKSQDLEKAAWYVAREITKRKAKETVAPVALAAWEENQ